MTQQTEAQKQQAILQEIAQYVGAKWGKPAVLSMFGGEANTNMMMITVGLVNEPQFAIIGREATARGEWMQRVRFTTQLNQPGG